MALRNAIKILSKSLSRKGVQYLKVEVASRRGNMVKNYIGIK